MPVDKAPSACVFACAFSFVPMAAKSAVVRAFHPSSARGAGVRAHQRRWRSTGRAARNAFGGMGGAFSKPAPSPAPSAPRAGAGTFDDIQKSFSAAQRGAGCAEPAPPAPRARRRWRFSIFGPSRRRQETSLAGNPQKPPKPLKEGGSLAMRAREVSWPAAATGSGLGLGLELGLGQLVRARSAGQG